MMTFTATYAVVGTSFHQPAIAPLTVGDAVLVVHQPDNEYDPNAVAVMSTAGQVLGYLPKKLAPRFTDPQHGGTPGGSWHGEIVEFTEFEQTDGSPGRGLRIRL